MGKGYSLYSHGRHPFCQILLKSVYKIKKKATSFSDPRIFCCTAWVKKENFKLYSNSIIQESLDWFLIVNINNTLIVIYIYIKENFILIDNEILGHINKLEIIFR